MVDDQLLSPVSRPVDPAQHPDESRTVDSVADLLADLLPSDSDDGSDTADASTTGAQVFRGSGKVQPPPVRFKVKCACPDPNCNVEQIAQKVNKLFGLSTNAVIAIMTQLKEVSTLAIVAPGLRQAAAGVLIVLETIGLMGDNNRHLMQLVSQSLDNCFLLFTCKEIIDYSSPVADKAKAKLNEVATEFSQSMAHITATMLALNRRAKVLRRLTKADKSDLDNHRIVMCHIISKLQIVLQLASMTKLEGLPRRPSASPPVSPPVQPSPAKFEAKCACPDPNCNVEQIAPKGNKFLGASTNAAIAVMAQLKELEVSTLAAVAPGMRQVAGSVLIVLESIGLMGDNVAHFDQLASQSLDNYLLLATCKEIIDDDSPVAKKTKETLSEVAAEFSKVVAHITESMATVNQRSKLGRHIFAKVDKDDMKTHRNAMTHMVNKLQITVQIANTCRQVRGGDRPLFDEPVQEKVHSTGENTTISPPQIHIHPTVIINAGDNANLTQAANVNIELRQSQVNDYSNHVNTYYADDRQGECSSSQRRNEQHDAQDLNWAHGLNDEDDTPRPGCPECARREQEEQIQLVRRWSL
ncbi:hypothetical protein BKA70DRAFT_1268932 [Coprinopsis sp. MPI-PUGE-AT-0042]|nr:hypothetical protein BKA70DRAFT_1268932 [Coprinopsis sp. MPI-PUGE-AT-0042]